MAGRTQSELASYALLSQFDSHSVTAGQRQSAFVRNHLQGVEAAKVKDFTRIYQEMIKSKDCKATANKLVAQLTALKKDPEIRENNSNINAERDQQQHHEEKSDRGSEKSKKSHHHNHHKKPSSSIKKEDYKKVKNRRVIGPVELLIQKHSSHIIKQLETQE